MKKSKEEPLNLPAKKNDYNKPEQKSHFLEWALFFIGLVILIYFAYPSVNSYCDKHPDKCVCERYNLKKVIGNGCIWTDDGCVKEKKDCTKFRKKTQEELDIDNCNNNPREDEKCKCNEIRYYDNIANNSLEKFNCNDADLTKQNLCKHYNLMLDKYFKHCIKSRPKTEYEKKPQEYNCNLWKLYFYSGYAVTNHTYLYTDEALEYQKNDDFLSDIKFKECVIWSNKTECEKGNPNIKETKIEEVDTSIIPHKECKLQTGWFCPAVGIVKANVTFTLILKQTQWGYLILDVNTEKVFAFQIKQSAERV